jgi:hypothetical protein
MNSNIMYRSSYTKLHTNHTRDVEGTDINSFMPFSHEWPSLRQQSQNAQQSIHACMGHIQYEVVSKSVEKSKNMGKISFMPLHR